MTPDDDPAPSAERTRLDPRVVARRAGLRYVSDSEPGYTRVRWGKGFTYRDAEGNTVRDRKLRRRFEALVIPPAWTEVWICPDPIGHIQVTGRDERGRKQYRYHPLWREVRDRSKFSRMIVFGMSLPRMRSRVDADLRLEGLPYAKVLAAAVRVLDTAPIRIGNEKYARENDSYGLTTMRDRHVEIDPGGAVRFRFRGKSGKSQYVGIADEGLANVVRECAGAPGAELFQYRDESGTHQPIDSADVNAYLSRLSGYDLTAKDFRTWAGTVRLVTVLRELGPAPGDRERRSKLVQAIRLVAADLGNTPATCRAYYIHPGVPEAYEEGRLFPLLDEIGAHPDSPAGDGLRPEERTVMALLPRLDT